MDALAHILADAVAGGGILCFLFLVDPATLPVLFFRHTPEAHAEVEGIPALMLGDGHVLQLLRGIPIAFGHCVGGQTHHPQEGRGEVGRGTAAHAAEVVAGLPVFSGSLVVAAVAVVQKHGKPIHVVRAKHFGSENIPALHLCVGDPLQAPAAAHQNGQAAVVDGEEMIHLPGNFPVSVVIAGAQDDVLDLAVVLLKEIVHLTTPGIKGLGVNGIVREDLPALMFQLAADRGVVGVEDGQGKPAAGELTVHDQLLDNGLAHSAATHYQRMEVFGGPAVFVKGNGFPGGRLVHQQTGGQDLLADAQDAAIGVGTVGAHNGVLCLIFVGEDGKTGLYGGNALLLQRIRQAAGILPVGKLVVIQSIQSQLPAGFADAQAPYKGGAARNGIVIGTNHGTEFLSGIHTGSIGVFVYKYHDGLLLGIQLTGKGQGLVVKGLDNGHILLALEKQPELPQKTCANGRQSGACGGKDA